VTCMCENVLLINRFDLINTNYDENNFLNSVYKIGLEFLLCMWDVPGSIQALQVGSLD
jgi:hypothetical protein